METPGNSHRARSPWSENSKIAMHRSSHGSSMFCRAPHSFACSLPGAIVALYLTRPSHHRECCASSSVRGTINKSLAFNAVRGCLSTADSLTQYQFSSKDQPDPQLTSVSQGLGSSFHILSMTPKKLIPEEWPAKEKFVFPHVANRSHSVLPNRKRHTGIIFEKPLLFTKPPIPVTPPARYAINMSRLAF